ncbi:unnamed protein product [Calicophoron daubneyi]|uniref:SH3 domain-containing protein n=1 Tax=Calicophoron daubneyi TaxID=300641 RepID=A0AAV2T397_CALDB
MLVHAVYPYNGPFDGSLKFNAGEIFLKVRKENDYWYLVARKDGTLGCVPHNYVEEHKNPDPQVILDYAKKALECAKHCKMVEQKNKEGVLRYFLFPKFLGNRLIRNSRLRELANEKNEDKQNVGASSRVVRAERSSKMVEKPPSPHVAQIESPQRGATQVTMPKTMVPGGLASRLVDALRLGTNADYLYCYGSFRIMLELLANEVPELRPHANLLDTMLTKSTADQRNLMYTQSPDWYLLKKYFGALGTRHSNDQECGWQLHEDQTELEHKIAVLTDILIKSNPELLRFYLSTNKYEPLTCLIDLYLRELRLPIRRRLLLATGLCCSLDKTCSHVGLSSVLPMEIIRELNSVNSESNVPYISMCLRVLTVLFARATELPVDVKSKLNDSFFANVLRLVGLTSSSEPTISLIDFDSLAPTSEENGKNDVLFHGQLAYAAVTFLLSCNWHYCTLAAKRMADTEGDKSAESHKTPLVRALINHPSASRSFVEFAVQAFNRDLDPIFKVDVKCKPNPSRLKRLIRWADAVSSSGSVCTDNGLRLTESNTIASVLDMEEADESDLSPLLDDAGQYAASLWSDSLNKATDSHRNVSLPTNVSPATPHNSVVRLLYDLFSAPDSANLVYTTDRDVIVDVINREIRDLDSSENERLFEYVLLLGLIIAHSDYLSQGAYKGAELVESLEALLKSHSTRATSSSALRRGWDLTRVTLNRLKNNLKT